MTQIFADKKLHFLVWNPSVPVASFDVVVARFPEVYVNSSFEQTEMVRKYHKITLTEEERKQTIADWKVISKELKKEGESWKGNIQLQPESDDEYLYAFDLDYVQGIWIPRAATKVRVGESKPYREDLFGPDKLLPLPRLGPILEMQLAKVQKARPTPHADQKGIWLLTKGVENTQGKRDLPAGSMQFRFTAKDVTLRMGLVSRTFPYATSPKSNPPLLRMGPGGPDARNTGLYRFTDPNTLELVQSGLPRGQEPALFADGDKPGCSLTPEGIAELKRNLPDCRIGE